MIFFSSFFLPLQLTGFEEDIIYTNTHIHTRRPNINPMLSEMEKYSIFMRTKKSLCAIMVTSYNMPVCTVRTVLYNLYAFIYTSNPTKPVLCIWKILQTLADKLHNIDFHLVVVVATWNCASFHFLEKSVQLCSTTWTLFTYRCWNLETTFFYSADIEMVPPYDSYAHGSHFITNVFCAPCRNCSCWFSIFYGF